MIPLSLLNTRAKWRAEVDPIGQRRHGMIGLGMRHFLAQALLDLHKPDTTFGNVKADVLVDKEPGFKPGNFCAVIRGYAWQG